MNVTSLMLQLKEILDTIEKQYSDRFETTRYFAALSKEEWIQKRALALIEEVTEVLNEVNYKWWKNPKEVDERAVKEEIVDILHFLVSMALSAGMSAKEMFEIYLDKNEENFKRQFGTSAKHGYELAENK